MLASIKVAKARQLKKIFAAVAILIIIAVAFSIVYLNFFYYNNSTDDIKLSLFSDNPTQLGRGTQNEIGITVIYNPKDHITLTLSNNIGSWANFAQNGQPKITITDGSANIILLVRIPDDASPGHYSVNIDATNSAGRIAVNSYAFDVT